MAAVCSLGGGPLGGGGGLKTGLIRRRLGFVASSCLGAGDGAELAADGAEVGGDGAGLKRTLVGREGRSGGRSGASFPRLFCFVAAGVGDCGLETVTGSSTGVSGFGEA